MTEREQQSRKFKARAMRCKKPLVKGLNWGDMQQRLSEMQEGCENLLWLGDSMGDVRRALTEAIGDSDEAAEYETVFALLQDDLNRLQEDMRNLYRMDEWDIHSGEFPVDDEGRELLLFDDFLVAARATGEDHFMMGFDDYEQDYYRLGEHEEDEACADARKRLERLTKKQLVDIANKCFNICFQYISLENRYTMLEAAINVLMDTYGGQLETMGKLNELYDAATADDWKSDIYGFQFDQLAGTLPPDVWLE